MNIVPIAGVFVPKSYDEFKHELQENYDEIKLTGSSKKLWVNLAKLVGEKKFNCLLRCYAMM